MNKPTKTTKKVKKINTWALVNVRTNKLVDFSQDAAFILKGDTVINDLMKVPVVITYSLDK